MAFNIGRESNENFALNEVWKDFDNIIMFKMSNQIKTQNDELVLAAQLASMISQVWEKNPKSGYQEVIEIMQNSATEFGEI